MKYQDPDLIKKKIEEAIVERRKKLKIHHIYDLIEKYKNVGCIKEITMTDEMVLVRLHGDIDSSTIPIAENHYKSQRSDEMNRHILLDFKEVGHIDSATLAYIIMLFFALKQNNKKLAVVNAPKSLLNYLDILNLTSIVEIYDDEKKAVADLVKK